jgi:predicted RNase H-like HicB family nuclease
MRTNIVIDDRLLAIAQRATGIKTKRGVVQEGLRVLVRLHPQAKVKAWRFPPDGTPKASPELRGSRHIARGGSVCHAIVMKLRYVVTIEREADGRFIASVPEVPGCHVYGRTRRQAVARARSALQFYVDSLRSQGRKPPRQPLVAVEVEVAA